MEPRRHGEHKVAQVLLRVSISGKNHGDAFRICHIQKMACVPSEHFMGSTQQTGRLRSVGTRCALTRKYGTIETRRTQSCTGLLLFVSFSGKDHRDAFGICSTNKKDLCSVIILS